MIDTGASINVMDENAFSKLQSHNKRNQVKLRKPKTKIYAFMAVQHHYPFLARLPQSSNRVVE